MISYFAKSEPLGSHLKRSESSSVRRRELCQWHTRRIAVSLWESARELLDTAGLFRSLPIGLTRLAGESSHSDLSRPTRRTLLVSTTCRFGLFRRPLELSPVASFLSAI
jgi:hypothetical protein